MVCGALVGVRPSQPDHGKAKMGVVVCPPAYLDLDGPLVFLAGPIQGAGDWQDDAISYLTKQASGCNIASPRRSYPPVTFDYDVQVDWETHHLRRAAQQGVILFWLATEKEHDCNRSYAQTTRFELAEWKARHERDGAPLVVGIEEGFSGARYIRRRFGQDCPTIPILSTLEDACRSAIEAIHN
jgi:hypothetical protein